MVAECGTKGSIVVKQCSPVAGQPHRGGSCCSHPWLRWFATAWPRVVSNLSLHNRNPNRFCFYLAACF
ncbi:uncharacterized protein DS421_11g349380 [Arachis hypogaea]|nr:uncharacterized protein DS421_11g349380 [Arachis hypogaea]